MKIKWNGHASFTITAADGTVIVTDPYEPNGFGGAIKYDPVDDRADVVLISHDHADHNHPQTLKGSPVVLKQAGSAKGIEFAGVEAAHDEKGGAERGKDMIFVFTVDGLRVAFMGDLGHLLDPAQLKALGKVDILLTPVGGVFTLDPKGAAKLVDQIQPRLVIPMHYKTPKCGFPLAAVDDFAKLMTHVKKIAKSELDLAQDPIPAKGPEVWVLDYTR